MATHNDVIKKVGTDSTLALLREGNTFISTRCDHYDTDIFQTRLMLKTTFCMRGEEAANIFYTQGKSTRVGAMPSTTLALLQDKGSVATLDDAAHNHRKAMFMSLLNPRQTKILVDTFAKKWIHHFQTRRDEAGVPLFDIGQEILMDATCEWIGIPPNQIALKQRTSEVAAMIDGAGSVMYRNWRGALLRRKTEQWLEQIITACRAGVIQPKPESGLSIISFHKDLSGQLLKPEVACVELLNLIRPTVAVARYILFAAMALNENPRCSALLKNPERKYRWAFIQEVRRFYPFFPFIGGIIREAFTWRNQCFAVGTRLMLDVYGTCRDGRIWRDPLAFEPERFLNASLNPYNFLPQGGGDYLLGHRCAGEHLTIALLERSIDLLMDRMEYDVVQRDYSIDKARMPALPKRDFLVTNINMKG